MVKYCSDASERGLCGLVNETMSCTCKDPNLAEIASLGRAGLCQTDRVVHTFPSPPSNPHSSKLPFPFLCHAVYFYLHTSSPPPLSPPHTQTPIFFFLKKRQKKNAACSPNIQIMQGTFPSSYHMYTIRTAKTYFPPNSAPVPDFAAQHA